MFNDQVAQTKRAFSPSDYPHTYVASKGYKTFTSVFAVLFSMPTLGLIWYFVSGHTIVEPAIRIAMLAIFLLLLALGAITALNTSRFKIVLHPDRIDYQGMSSGWSVGRSQISNWRLRNIKGNNILELTSTEAGGGLRKCTLQFKPDATFVAWFADLPNADLLEMKASEDEIRQNPEFGNTPEERLENAARARKIAGALSVFVIVTLYWTMISTRPYNLPVWVCLAMPWLAIVMGRQGKGLYTLGEWNKKSAKANLTAPLLFPVFVLAVHAAQSMSMLHWTDAIVPGIVVGLGLSVLAGSISSWFANARKWVLFIVLFCSVYAIAAVIVTNKLLDSSVPANYPVKILAHRQTYGKGATSYLTVSNWGPQTTRNEFVVDRRYYDSKSIGDIICIHVHEGVYRMPWYSLDDCTPE